MTNQTFFVEPVALPRLMTNVMLCVGRRRQQNEIFNNFEHRLKLSKTTVFTPLSGP